MPNYSDHKVIIELLEKDQDADKDNRDRAKEAHLFIDKRDGQWEPSWWNNSSGKPRYTFDMTTPIINQIAGEMQQADFNITVRPSGGEASKKTANVLDGLIRNIENISNATHIYSNAGRAMVVGGIDGWRVVQKYVDADSFDQDLMIEPLHNFVDRVWFDCAAEKQDRSDARWCHVITGVSVDEYEDRWPEGGKVSVSLQSETNAYYHKPEFIIVGEFYYIKPKMRELVEMNNGAVYEVNDEFNALVDEMAAAGIVEKRRRKQAKNVVYVRHYDGQDWLGEPRETVFSHIPVIPTYANYKIFENKTIYFGVVEKLLDPQRVMNYSISREIEEGALSPRPKYWMTSKQVGSHGATLETLNTNADPVQIYDPDPLVQNPPMQSGGAQINPGLRIISEAMSQIMNQTAGMFAANMGDNPGLQSGIAIRQLQRKGETGTIAFFSAQEVAISHTARILVDAIPRVYDTKRQARILNEDGSFEMVALNDEVIDEETGRAVTLNDLSKGRYDVTCSAGPAFKSRQDELVASIVELSQVDPSLISIGGDVLLNALSAPGMDKIAERKRAQLLASGVIPESQMTDDEKAQMQAQAQNRQPDAATMLAQAEMEKAKAAQMKVEVDGMLRQTDQEIAMAKVEQTGQKDAITAQQLQQEFNLKLEKMQQDILLAMDERELRRQVAVGTMQKTQAETLSLLSSAASQPNDGQVGQVIDEEAVGMADEIDITKTV